MKTASFGTVSHATMRAEDLIPAFVSALEDLAEGDEHKVLIAEANAYDPDEPGSCDSEDGILEDLFDALNEAAPAYAYFGAHPGDGSDYGFWLSEDFEQEFDGLKVGDTGEVPADYDGEVLHVSDHGNPTLYSANKGHLTEVWALV